MKAFGMELQVDLYGCNANYIRDESKIYDFVIELCELIKMKRFGDPTIVRFGEDPSITGYSMCQLIETSLISAHFAESKNSVYLNVFSCKDFSPDDVVIFASKYFKAKNVEQNLTIRM